MKKLASLLTDLCPPMGKPNVCWPSGWYRRSQEGQGARLPNWNAIDDENNDNKSYCFSVLF